MSEKGTVKSCVSENVCIRSSDRIHSWAGYKRPSQSFPFMFEGIVLFHLNFYYFLDIEVHCSLDN